MGIWLPDSAGSEQPGVRGGHEQGAWLRKDWHRELSGLCFPTLLRSKTADPGLPELSHRPQERPARCWVVCGGQCRRDLKPVAQIDPNPGTLPPAKALGNHPVPSEPNVPLGWSER